MEVKKYYNRDLSWLKFNQRVLDEARDLRVPLFERLRFLAIYSSNLDEFYSVRVAYILSIARLDKEKYNKRFGMAPKELLDKIQFQVDKQLQQFSKILHLNILPEFRDQGIYIYYDRPIPRFFKNEIRHFFQSKVMAYLQPKFLEEDPVDPYFLNNGRLYFFLKLKQKQKQTTEYAHLNIPSNYIPRMLKLTSQGQIKGKKEYHFVLLDDIIKANIHLAFPQHEVLACYSIKLNKDADLNIEDEYSGDLVNKIRLQLKKRNINSPSRFLFDRSMPEDLLQAAGDFYHLNTSEMIGGDRYHNHHDFMKLRNPIAPILENRPLKTIRIPYLDKAPTIYDIIKNRDVLLHFPYQSYDYIIRLFNEAAVDPAVTHIKATLYRIASESLVARALISAVNNGKKVTVFVEVKARFDEENNLHWARKMEKAGIRILYSIPGLKVHSKIALFKRNYIEYGGPSGYAFFGTGNFNESTAKIYADHALLTRNDEMITELDQLFDYLYRKNAIKQLNHLLISQFNMQQKFVKKLNREIQHVNKGRKGHIIIKVNNLEDPIVMDKLYEASQAGVKIDLLVRGICCIRPQVKGLSENINVYRLIDRYLEHARIFWFANHGQEELYMASADWMRRNLYGRIEVGFPIYNPNLIKEVKALFDFQLRDNTKMVKLDSDHNMYRTKPKKNEPLVQAQVDFHNWLEENQN